jgi:uncharacterized protein YdeI (YjbR/CyaY-like superfamily)
VEGKLTPRGFASQAAFRAWLEKNHQKVPELYVRCVKSGADRGLGYREALDEALCYGWIDGVRHALDATSFSQRFTPRRAGSQWSTVNIKRFRELQAAGRVRPAGLAAFEARVKRQYSFESRPKAFAPELERRFRANAAAWRFFEEQAPWYRRICSFYVMSAKQAETRERRLARLIECSERGVGLPGLKGTRARPADERQRPARARAARGRARR